MKVHKRGEIWTFRVQVEEQLFFTRQLTLLTTEAGGKVVRLSTDWIANIRRLQGVAEFSRRLYYLCIFRNINSPKMIKITETEADLLEYEIEV